MQIITENNFRNFLFYVGVVKHEPNFIHIKVGKTEETCKKSKTLKVPKSNWSGNDFYRSIGPMNLFIFNELQKNNFINFGDSDAPEQEIEIVQHRFSLNVPSLPITRL
jgi:hypothetical protein